MRVSISILLANLVSSSSVPKGAYCGVSTRLDCKLALKLDFNNVLKEVSISVANDRGPTEYEYPVMYNLYQGVILLDDHDNGFSQFLKDQFGMSMTTDSFIQFYNKTADIIDATVILSNMFAWDITLSKGACVAPMLSGAYSSSDTSVFVRFNNKANTVHVERVLDDGSEIGRYYSYVVSSSGLISLASADNAALDISLEMVPGSDALYADFTDSAGVVQRKVLAYGNSILPAVEEFLAEFAGSDDAGDSTLLL